MRKTVLNNRRALVHSIIKGEYMKNTAIAAVLFISGIGVTTSSIASNDPCSVVICMMGKVSGQNGGKDCKSAESKFFSLIKKKHGSFNASRTSNYRKSFLGDCPTADPKDISKIISKFGRSKFGF